MNTTNSVIVMNAATQANAAAANAAAASHRAECRIVLGSYRPESATRAEMHQYAGCVQYLYPAPMDPGISVWLKAAIVILLLSVPAGGWWGWRCERHIGIALCGAALAPMGAALVLLGFAAMVAGAHYVFTG